MNHLSYLALRSGMRLMGDCRSVCLTRGELAWITGRYPSAGRSTRALIALRAAGLASFLRVADGVVPSPARVLDAGCGHGLVAHWMARDPRRDVVGIEVAEGRLAVAESSDYRTNLAFERGSVLDLSDHARESWDAVLFADLLVCVPFSQHGAALRAARDASTDDAVLIIRESATVPRWKHTAMRLEERIKWRLGYYGPRPDGVPAHRDMENWRALLADSGWRVGVLTRTGERGPYPGWISVCQAMPRCASPVSQ